MTALPVPFEWRQHAACIGQDPDLFFPDTGYQEAAALTFCVRCPVAVDGLTYALEHHEKHGIWGGHTQGDQRRLRARRQGRPWRTVARVAIEDLRNGSTR